MILVSFPFKLVKLLYYCLTRFYFESSFLLNKVSGILIIKWYKPVSILYRIIHIDRFKYQFGLNWCLQMRIIVKFLCCWRSWHTVFLFNMAWKFVSQFLRRHLLNWSLFLNLREIVICHKWLFIRLRNTIVSRVIIFLNCKLTCQVILIVTFY